MGNNPNLTAALAEALRPFALMACSDPGACDCHNCRGRDLLALFDAAPPFPLSLLDLREANAARHVEWWEPGTDHPGVSLGFRGLELGGEVGEALNVIKKIERERLGIKGSRDTLEQLAEELADVVICADLVAMDTGIDLGVAVARKFNATSEKVGLKARIPVEPG